MEKLIDIKGISNNFDYFEVGHCTDVSSVSLYIIWKKS